MILKEGETYVIVFKIEGHLLTFQCEIIEDDGTFVTFVDKYSKQISYNKNLIISVEEKTW